MVQGVQEIAAMLVGLMGLIGAAATTGMPMWKVTAFIGENIIVMETRWEGLWMNCYRQASIRMQCKVYDSLLFLPPDLQAARGLMCCSLALSGLGLLAALAGMRCISCIRGNERAKVIILIAGGSMQFAACLCVLIPVSWTAHAIIRDFYNPLLIDAQRRELGEALYIGWVTGAFLFASGVLFTCRRMSEDKGAYQGTGYRDQGAGYLHQGAEYPHQGTGYPHQGTGYPQQGAGYPYQGAGVGYRVPADPLMSYNPVSSVSSLATGTLSPVAMQAPLLLQDNRMTQFHPNGLFYPVGSAHLPVFPPAFAAHNSPNFQGSLPTPETSVYTSPPSTAYTRQPMQPLAHHPSASGSYHTHFHPAPQNPLFISYRESRVEPGSSSGVSHNGVYI
ncbi:hypothetical protein NHX12_008712 [Muraenolepis orangiensis]|uniref:Claudin n=1 Tax=Muraenolepis orangiensis TaxID=630683 RepID=A0A9Q0DNL3_9TELE|nr:hypothetical protein NHX12_008712 [Muraenolepis orangiensis]